MLRITTAPDGKNSVRVKIEGSLREPWLAELTAECERAGRDRSVKFDLSAVTFADQAGVRFLRHWLQRGAAIDACSGFVAELMRHEEQK